MTIPPEMDAQMRPDVRAFVELLLGRVVQLEDEVADLRRRLEKAERGSHQTTDPPNPEPARPVGSAADVASENPVKKKRGGQPGNRRRVRKLMPTENC